MKRRAQPRRKTSPIFVRDERTTRTFAAAGGAAGGGGADVQARSLDARVAFEDVYKRFFFSKGKSSLFL